jgi:hypothetical protein
MWDPKSLDEDRTPQAPKPAERQRGGLATSRVAAQDETCADCRQPIRIGDDIMDVQTVFAESPGRSVWHRECWTRAYPENLAHYFSNFVR